MYRATRTAGIETAAITAAVTSIVLTIFALVTGGATRLHEATERSTDTAEVSASAQPRSTATAVPTAGGASA